jgi:hypothetical protein
MLDRSSEVESAFARLGIGSSVPDAPAADDWQGPTEIPDYADGEPLVEPEHSSASVKFFAPITPLAWKGTEPVKQRWLAGAFDHPRRQRRLR